MLKVAAKGQAVEGTLGPQTLDTLAREGAQAMLHYALEVEVAAYLERHQERDAREHALVVRNGKACARKLTCGAGTLTVEAPPGERPAGRRRRAAAAVHEPDPAALHAALAQGGRSAD